MTSKASRETKKESRPARRSFRRRAVYIAALIILPFVFDLGYFARGLLPEPKAPGEVPEVDVIVVLTGGQGRIKEAVDFLVQGKSKHLFISGVEPDFPLSRVLRANHIATLPDEVMARISLGDARSTSENATEVREVVERLQAHSILLVTSTYHMRRAKNLIQNELEDHKLACVIHTYPVESPNYERRSWWRSFSGWRILLSEYFKSLPVRFLPDR